jgi:hypothetical protein
MVGFAGLSAWGACDGVRGLLNWLAWTVELLSSICLVDCFPQRSVYCMLNGAKVDATHFMVETEDHYIPRQESCVNCFDAS